MPISQPPHRLILIVVIALLGTAAKATSAERVSTVVDSTVSELPNQTTAIATISPDPPPDEPATLSSTIAAIPEPGTLLLFGTSLMALALWSRARVRRVSRK